MCYFIYSIILLVSLLLHSDCAQLKQVFNAHPSTSTMYSEFTISFGSLYHLTDTDEPDILDQIVKSKPDVFLWLGEVTVERGFRESNILDLKKKSSYLTLAKTTHISGIADIDPTNEHVKNAFFYFLDEPFKSVRRNRNGLFDAFWISASPGFQSPVKTLVKVMLLNVAKEDEQYDEISKEQWQWISDELQEDQESHILTVIASPYQILPSDKLYDEAVETSSKIKLLKLIAKSPVPVILVSGTLLYSFGEVLKYPCSDSDLGYNLYEISSAGLNSNDFQELKILNKLSVPEKFNNFTDRTFKPNFGQLKIRYNHIKPQTSELLLEIVDEKGMMLVSRSPKWPEKPEKTKKTSETSEISRCARKLYDDKRMYRDLIKHFIKTLFDREFRVIVFAALAFLLSLISATCYFGSIAIQKGAQSQSEGASEYEKYHMD